MGNITPTYLTLLTMKKPTRSLILECSLYYFLSKKQWKVDLIGEELVKTFATLEIGMEFDLARMLLF